MISGEILRRLYRRADFDEIPVAELLRRIIDLAVTFKLPPATPILPAAAEAPVPFIAIMPRCMIAELNDEATNRQTTPDELVRLAAIYYLIKRQRVVPLTAAAGPDPTPDQAA